jgi:hypothetical protein
MPPPGGLVSLPCNRPADDVSHPIDGYNEFDELVGAWYTHGIAETQWSRQSSGYSDASI